MRDKIQKFVNKTREPFSYINDILDLILKIWGISVFLLLLFNNTTFDAVRQHISDLSMPIKIFFVGIMVFSFYYLLNDCYRKIKFIWDMKKLSNNLETEIINETQNQLISNYKGIIPSTTVFKEISNTFEKRAKRWSSDSCLFNHELIIWVKMNKVDIELRCGYFSQRKKAVVEFKTIDMKVPKDSGIKISQLRYTDSALPIKPIFSEIKWQKFIAGSLDRLESVVAGCELYLSINMDPLGIVILHLNPHFSPQRFFCFYLKSGVMYKDYGCREKIAEL